MVAIKKVLQNEPTSCISTACPWHYRNIAGVDIGRRGKGRDAKGLPDVSCGGEWWLLNDMLLMFAMT
jgi:hypothetical protein